MIYNENFSGEWFGDNYPITGYAIMIDKERKDLYALEIESSGCILCKARH